MAQFTFESFIILLLMVCIVGANVVILLVLYRTEHLTFINRYFFVSLTLSDLFIGAFVVPFSFLSSLFDSWVLGDMFCHVEAYLAAIFWIASVYSLMWLGIDHYIAIRKPDRYESLMTPMRCICWVAFIWVAALSFCCPPLFGVSRARYYAPAYLCIIDWHLQKAYFITSGILILIPPIIALSCSNLYIFTAQYREQRAVYEKCTDSNSRAEFYLMNFVVGVMLLLVWSPWCILQVYELYLGAEEVAPWSPPSLHFFFMWLVVANSFFKFLVYVVLCHDFRIGLKVLYTQLTCFKINR
jgi:hypothetical protein